jgi:DNA-binding GntR family transcriptional regulator
VPIRSLVTERDQIVDALRRQILSGAEARGERTPQDDLARQFGASITRALLTDGEPCGDVASARERNRQFHFWFYG